jgi:hypothetical protein
MPVCEDDMSDGIYRVQIVRYFNINNIRLFLNTGNIFTRYFICYLFKKVA